MLTDSALSTAERRRGLPDGSPPPARAATPISRMILVKILPRCASTAFLRASMEGPLPMVSGAMACDEVRNFSALGAGAYPVGYAAPARVRDLRRKGRLQGAPPVCCEPGWNRPCRKKA